VGGTLAKYAAEGADVFLVTARRPTEALPWPSLVG
jgi:hypothetical protein